MPHDWMDKQTFSDDSGMTDCDLLVIGGGVNGSGIARDAAGRGLSVILCEKDDLAAHTSSSSTKLIHGGLRYLEHYEFRLVRKALQEREVLLRSAPHLIRPLRFVMPHDEHQRPAWLIRCGLFLYDHLARRDLLSGSGRVDLRSHPTGAPLKAGFVQGFVYSDAAVDDSRLVVLNAVDAARLGARIFTRTRCASVARQERHWRAALQRQDGSTVAVRARCLVNAAGPWAAEFEHCMQPARAPRHVRLVKGSHIVVPKLFDHPFAYIFQHPDRRIVFAIPYQGDFTLIGTTDLEFSGNPDEVAIDPVEIRYLCELCNYYFQRSIAATDVVWAYSGVRPLLEDAAADPAAVTRDYHFEIDDSAAPCLSVFGGKITTFRKLAEEAVDRISAWLGANAGAWTADGCLPGGDLFGAHACNRSVLEFDPVLERLRRDYSWLPGSLVERYFHAYGTRLHMLLDGCSSVSDLGREILPGLFELECRYWMQHEWALTAEDMLWRRSKLGLRYSDHEAATLAEWIAGQPMEEFASGMS